MKVIRLWLTPSYSESKLPSSLDIVLMDSKVFFALIFPYYLHGLCVENSNFLCCFFFVFLRVAKFMLPLGEPWFTGSKIRYLRVVCTRSPLLVFVRTEVILGRPLIPIRWISKCIPLLGSWVTPPSPETPSLSWLCLVLCSKNQTPPSYLFPFTLLLIITMLDLQSELFYSSRCHRYPNWGARGWKTW